MSTAHTPTPAALRTAKKIQAWAVSAAWNKAAKCDTDYDMILAQAKIIDAEMPHAALVAALDFVRKFREMQATKGNDIFPSQLDNAIDAALAAAKE